MNRDMELVVSPGVIEEVSYANVCGLKVKDTLFQAENSETS